jgi:hypothetical protein
MGVAFAMLFSWWFVSGIVMMFQGFPRVGEEERLARAPLLDAARIHVGPTEALQAAGIRGRIEQVRLRMFDGRPAYILRAARRQALVYADDGTLQESYPEPLRRRLAAAWTGQDPALGACGELREPDQWTVSGQFRTLRPLSKCAWPNGSEVYVSGATGEVVQATTRGTRLAAYFGAIPHYLYFTPLRVNQPLWKQVVIWSAGLGTVMALLGLVTGLLFLSPRRRYLNDGRPSAVPFTGPKRLHTLLGLFFGLLACTWAFSGMMSVDPFPALAGPRQRGGQIRLQTPPDLPAYRTLPPGGALAAVAGQLRVRQLELIAVHGTPYYLASERPSRALWVPLKGVPFARFDVRQIEDWARAALQPARVAQSRLVTEYELYYSDRRGRRPLPVIALHLEDAEHTVLYFDPARAQLVQTVNARSRWTRWLYRGLHSFDLPWLCQHRGIWYAAVLTLMLGGTVLSLTGMLLAWRRLRQVVRR